MTREDQYVKLTELDKLAVDYYLSARTLEIQCKYPSDDKWVDYDKDNVTPSFSNILQWRAKPKTRQITIGIFEDLETGRISTAGVGEDCHSVFTKHKKRWKLVKTIETEV